MRSLSEAERAKLRDKVHEVKREEHERAAELMESANPKPAILRAPWWAWALTAVAVAAIWWLIDVAESIAFRFQ